MIVRAGARPPRRRRSAAAGGLVLLALAGCGQTASRVAFSPTPQCDTSATTPRPVAGSPWTPVAADLPADFRGQVWVAGGPGGRIYAEGPDRLASLDLTTGTWSDLATLPRRRPASTLVAAPDGTLYVIGGQGEPGSSTGATADVDAFDATTAAWRTIAPLPSPRFDAAAAAGGDGRIYVFGGVDPTGQNVGTVSRLDPATGVWNDVARLAASGSDLAAVSLADGRILIVGGTRPAGGGTAAVIFDPAHDATSPVAAMPVAREAVGGIRGGDGRVYILGGRDTAEQVTASVEVFDPGAGRWTDGASMSAPRIDPGVARGPDGRVYAIGGDTTPVGGPGCALIGTVEAANL